MTAAPTANEPVSEPGTRGRFNYLDPSVSRSLYRNGKVLTRRDRDGSDAGSEGIVLEEREMRVRNARRLEGTADRRTVAAHGFELLTRPLQRSDLDFFDHREIVQSYYGECVRTLREATGAPWVFAFDHNVRSAAGKRSKQRIRGGQRVQGPAHLVHGDYTLTSAPERLQRLAKPPGGNDTLASILDPGQSLVEPALLDRALADHGRFAFINVWRNIAQEPVATHPIGLCEARSVHPADLVVFEIHYQDRVGENYFAVPSSRHRWFYYPAMTRDEVLLIKQWDSAGPLARSEGLCADDTDTSAPCTFSFHSAFEDRSTPAEAPERWSIEVRCVVVYA